MITPFVLPHRYPLLLLDRIIALDPGRSATACRQLTVDDPWLDANGTLPPVLLAEIMAQCAGVAVSGDRVTAGVLVKISRFRARPGAAAGGTLQVHTRITKVFGATVKSRAIVHLDRRRWAAAELVLQLVAPPSTTT